MEDLKKSVLRLDSGFEELKEAHRETQRSLITLLSDLPIILDKHCDRLADVVDSKLAACQKARKEATENQFLPVPPGFWKSMTTVLLWVVVGVSSLLGLDSIVSLIAK